MNLFQVITYVLSPAIKTVMVATNVTSQGAFEKGF